MYNVYIVILSLCNRLLSQINPDNSTSHELKGWFESVGKDMAVRQMSNSQGGGGANMDTPFKTLQEVKSANLQVYTRL